jgi:hypothetical protein
MDDTQIIWDLEDDPEGNYRHITDGHDVTADEVEEVLRDRANPTAVSRSSGERITFGWTASGEHIAVVWEHVQDDPLTIYPITAYPAPPPRSRRHGR